MNTKKITADEIKDIRVASLPSRPTAPASFGGKGYTAAQMKEAFDRLPLFIIERFNSLLDDISAYGPDSISTEIFTGISYEHTLLDLFDDVTNGSFAAYLSVGGITLVEYLAKIDKNIEQIKAELALLRQNSENTSTDAGA